MSEWLRAHVLAWTTSAAVTLAGMRFFTPSFMDMVIDLLTVALVWIAAKMAARH